MPRGNDDGSDSKRAKTETVTFRLQSFLIDELRMDAELEGISLNDYVAKIFSNHIQWERYERKVGLLPMTEAFLRRIFSFDGVHFWLSIRIYLKLFIIT